MRRILLPEIPSTNSWMLDALSQGETLVDETVVYTFRQTQGRGQVGNSWESEPGCNVTFSLLLRPVFLPVPRQFLISELCCLGVVDGLKAICKGTPAGDLFCSRLCVKWPNDIYVGDEKLGGILIENRLMGSTLSESILGVGINVNQRSWIGNAPNPTSLFLHGQSFEPELVLDAVSSSIIRRYRALRQDLDAYAAQLHTEFAEHLYRRGGWHTYVDSQTDEKFVARIAGVDPQGPLSLMLQNGDVRHYWFKEVKFVLPCGVIKE